MPPNKRNTEYLHKKLKAEEELGITHPYKIPKCARTFARWSTVFCWEERLYNKLHEDCENLELKAVEFNKYMYDKRTDSAINFENTLRKIEKLFRESIDSFDLYNRDVSQNIIALGHLIKNLNDLQDNRVPKMNEIYAGIKILSEVNSELADELENEIQQLSME